MRRKEPLSTRLRARLAAARGTAAAAAGTVLGALWRALPGLLGVALLSAGAWMAWPPAGLMTAGVLLLADLVDERLAERRRARR